jgi:chromosome segregation ATPase
MKISQRTLLVGALATIALSVSLRTTATTGASIELDQQQDVMRLETRITQLEQRLFSLENTLRSLEQQSRLSATSPRNVSQDELSRLHSDLEALQRRTTENECGLAKLDERTLTPQKRVERKRSGTADTNPCRLNADTPLRLP